MEDQTKTVLTDEELQEVNSMRTRAQDIYSQLGQLAVQKNNQLKQFEEAENKLQQQHAELIEIERKLVQSLNEKYGEGQLNPQTGEFTSSSPAE